MLAGVAAALAACASIPPPAAGPVAATITIVERSWHTDVCLNTADADAWVTAYARGFDGARALCFGFGVWARWQSRQPQNRETGFVGRGIAGLVLCGLFATAGVDLRLDDPEFATQRLGRGDGLLGAGRDGARRHRHAITGQNFFGLILVQIHPPPPAGRKAADCRGKRPAGPAVSCAGLT